MREKIRTEMVKAMKEKNAARLMVIRLINGEVNNTVKLNPNASDEDLAATLDSMVKRNNKAILEYEAGGAVDKVAELITENGIINEFLPERLSIEDIEERAAEVIKEMNATGMKDMGAVISKLKVEFGAVAKPSDISIVVKKLLS